MKNKPQYIRPFPLHVTHSAESIEKMIQKTTILLLEKKIELLKSKLGYDEIE